MEVIPVEFIPRKEDIIEAPLDNLAEVFKICQQLEQISTLENGIGLSAVQVGLPWQLFAVRNEDEHYDFYLNCRYEPSPGAQKIITHEGCLSLRTDNGSLRSFRVERWNWILLSGKRLVTEGKLALEDLSLVEIVDPLRAVVLQHEIDHQLGPEGLVSNKGEEIHIWDQRRK